MVSQDKPKVLYAAECITSGDDDIVLMIGVDTGVFDGFVKCGAAAITGIGCVLPHELLTLCNLSRAAAAGDPEARVRAQDLEAALNGLSSFDEGADLVLYCKYLLLKGEADSALHFNQTDALTASQRGYAKAQFALFNAWYAGWSRLPAGAGCRLRLQTTKPEVEKTTSMARHPTGKA